MKKTFLLFLFLIAVVTLHAAASITLSSPNSIIGYFYGTIPTPEAIAVTSSGISADIILSVDAAANIEICSTSNGTFGLSPITLTSAGGTIYVRAKLGQNITYTGGAGTYRKVTGTSGATNGSKTFTITITAASPTISFTSSTVNKNFGDANFTQAATSNSTGAITYASDNTSVATVATGGVVTIIGAGTAVITASQVANGNYTSGSTTYSVIVAAVPTITATTPIASTLSYQAGSGPSAETNFTITGAYLTNDVTVSPGTNVEISTTTGTGFQLTPITLSQSSGFLIGGTKTIYMRLRSGIQPGGTGSITRTITLTSTGATDKTAVLGAGYITGLQITGTSPTSTYTQGAGPGTEKSFTVIGAGLETTTQVLLTVGSNIEITTTAGNYTTPISSPASLQITGSTLPDPKITTATYYYRLKSGLSAGTYADATTKVSLSANGTSTLTGAFTTKELQVTGTVTTAPTISFASATVNKTFGDVTFTQTPTSNSAGAITYGSGSTSVATVNASSGLVTIVGVGSAVITATQTANGYFTSGTANYTVNVAAIAPNLAFATPTSVSKNYGDATFTNAATSSNSAGAISYGSGNTGVATINTSTGEITIVSAGSAVITATIAANGNYSSTTATYTVNVAGIAPNLAFATATSVSKNYGDATFTNAASSSNSAGAISYVSGNTGVATVNASTGLVTIVSAGSAVITATIAANGNYTSTTATYTVNVASIAPNLAFATPTSVSKNYGDAAFTNAASSSNSVGAISYVSGNTGVASVDASTGLVTIVSAGSAVITVTIAANGNYTSTTETYTVNVAKAAQTISFGTLPTGKIVGDADFAPGATSATSGTNAITYSSSNTAFATIVSGQIHLVGAGTCTIYADQALSDNYNAASQASQSLTVTAATATVDVNSTNNSSALSLATTSEVTVKGSAVLTVNAASEVKSLATSTGTKVIVNEPLVVNTGGVTLAPSSTFEVANTVDVTGNVEVGSGSKLNFTTANTLKITGDLILKADNAGTFSANLGSGGINVVGSGKVKYQRTIDDTKWYFMAFPCDVNVSEITGGGAIDVDWFIQQYNGQKRATNGAGANWEHVTSGVLTANRGYIFGSAAGDKTLTFLLTKAIVASESAKTIGVTNYTGATASTNYGWNLVGQPYISKYDANNGSNMSNMYIFDGLTYKDHYNNIYKQDLPVVDPFTAYFTKVVANGSLSFDLTSRQSTRSSVSTIIADVVYLDFTTATGTDRTNIVMDDTQSANYQNGVDYEKMITTGTAIPQVYTVLDGLNYSFNVLPTSSVVNLPLAIYTKTAGSTTISVDATKAKSLSKLLLLENGVVVADLLTSDYKFTAASGTSTTRFSITAQRIATDNNQIGNNLDAPKLSIVNCQLSIENLSPNSSVRVYDALGRMLVSKTANSNMMEIKLGARGIYTVLLQNGTTISTRKIIF